MAATDSAKGRAVRVTSLGHGVCATVAWRSRGQLVVTVIVKATFSLVPGGAMTLAAPLPILAGDEHHGGDPARGLRAASDLALYLTRADVIVTPSASAAPGAPARLRVTRDATTLLDKVAPAQAFGPIAHQWPARRRLLGALDPRALDEPFPAIHEGFDWAYFQAAPSDQQVDMLRGDEAVLLEGLHPRMNRIEARLPSARASATVYMPPRGQHEGKPLSLFADTLSIDLERGLATLLWRGNFPASADALATLHVVTSIDVPSAAPARAPQAAEPPAQPAQPARKQAARTVELTLDMLAARSGVTVTPFDRAAITGSPAAPVAAPPQRPATGPMAPVSAPALPFKAPSASPWAGGRPSVDVTPAPAPPIARAPVAEIASPLAAAPVTAELVTPKKPKQKRRRKGPKGLGKHFLSAVDHDDGKGLGVDWDP